MNTGIIRVAVRIGCLFFLVTLLAACSGQTTGTTPGVTPQAGLATATPTSSANPTATSAFQTFQAKGFSVTYPTGWQTGHRTITGTPRVVYDFLYSDQVTGFHVELDTDYVDASTPLNDLTNTSLNCDPNNSLPATVTVNGITWYQTDFICLLASTNYEIHYLSEANTRLGQGVSILYAAYQQATASPPFAQANTDFFTPMLQSFQLV